MIFKTSSTQSKMAIDDLKLQAHRKVKELLYSSSVYRLEENLTEFLVSMQLRHLQETEYLKEFMFKHTSTKSK